MQAPAENTQLLDVEATAKRLSLSPQMVRKLERRRELVAVRVGTRVLFSLGEIARYIRALEDKAATT